MFYFSRNCGNTHAYFIERSIKLLKQNGKFGFIVPISLVSTNRMDDIRAYIHGNSAGVKFFNFDDRPGKIFSGLEDCRSTIIVTKKGKGVEIVTTSKYNRWHTKDRSDLFRDLKTIVWELQNPKEIVPKLGLSMEKKILEKMKQKSRGKTLGDFTKAAGDRLWYHNAPRYWVHVHSENYVPRVEYYEGYEEDGETPRKLQDIRISDQYKPLFFESKYTAIVNGLLNSHLFYWWYIIWSDGRHLLLQHIENFPLNLQDFPVDLNKKLTTLASKLMEDYEKNSNMKINARLGGYVIKIKEIIPKLSKEIIDQIDDVFAEHFGFSDQQTKFIKDFDLIYRM